MRLKVQTIKTLVWFGCALSCAAILGLLVYIFLRVVPEIKDANKKRQKDLTARIQKAVGVQPTIKARERAQAINWGELENLHKLNVTGKEPPPPPAPDEIVDGNAPPPLQPIHEVLVVRSVISKSNNPSGGFATIHYKADPETPLPSPPVTVAPGVVPPRHVPGTVGGYIQVGDTLRDPYNKAPFHAKVVAIAQDGVEFEWGGERVKVMPPTLPQPQDVNAVRTLPGLNDTDPSAAGGDASGGAESRRANPAALAESKAINENDWYIGTDELARLEKEGKDLLDEIELATTTAKSEKRMRLQMKKVPEGSLAHQRGFRDGDILRTINGEDMSNKSNIVKYFETNSRQSKFSIEIERFGSKVTKVFTLAR